ncbi:hypothetical protein IFR05_017268 [Cadophora sp. M221]|nr:hypothetical protein IFR05_017268 [Cadophora sp. M221]
MPPQRTPLAATSGNRGKGYELSLYLRGQILGQARRYTNPYEIARDLKLNFSTIKYTIKQEPLCDDGKSLPRKPRGKSYTVAAEERKLLRHVRLHPKDTYQEVITACSLSCKETAVKKILKEHRITNWRAKRRLNSREYTQRSVFHGALRIDIGVLRNEE